MGDDVRFRLDDDLLERIRSRAAGYDAANAFPHEDLAELREAGYLGAGVPAELGGHGLSLRELAAEQRRLAAAAPATALAINMHLVWTSVAVVLRERGDASLEFLLREAADGELFAFGISEAGNDLVLLDSGTVAEPQPDGGYRFTGRKVFTSLAPVWTRLGVFGRDDASPDAPKLVYAFLERGDAIAAEDDWDMLGMRATRSNTTRLDAAPAAPDRVIRRLDPGPNPDPLVFAIFAGFEVLVANVYAGLATRALELATASASARTSRATGLRAADDPVTRWKVAEAAIELDGLLVEADALARDVDEQAAHGSLWFAKLVGLKTRAARVSGGVVRASAAIAGASGYRADAELARLQRDVLAAGFHPSNEDSAHRTVADAWLGPIGR